MRGVVGPAVTVPTSASPAPGIGNCHGLVGGDTDDVPASLLHVPAYFTRRGDDQ